MARGNRFNVSKAAPKSKVSKTSKPPKKKVFAAVGIIVLLLYAVGSFANNTPKDSSIDATGNVPQDKLATSELFVDASTGKPSKTSTLSAPQGTLRVHFIDVGQGDSAFIELPDGKTMLIDAGPADNANKITSLLSTLGCSKIDYLVATHPHEDHIGGMAMIINRYDIGEIWAPKVSHNTKTFENFLDTISAKGLTIHSAVASSNMGNSSSSSSTAENSSQRSGRQIYTSQGCAATLLYPLESSSPANLNDWSAILLLEFGKTSILFAGDVSASIISNACKSNVDVLKVSHHGSVTGTNSALISQLTPRYAVISCGANNSYGHPHEEALLALAGTFIYRTDIHKTITATSDGKDIEFEGNLASDESSKLGGSISASSGNTPSSEPESNSQNLGVGTSTEGSSSSSTTVYTTNTGKKYHIDGCRHLSKSKIPMAIDRAKSQGYDACKTCNPPR